MHDEVAHHQATHRWRISGVMREPPTSHESIDLGLPRQAGIRKGYRSPETIVLASCRSPAHGEAVRPHRLPRRGSAWRGGVVLTPGNQLLGYHPACWLRRPTRN